REDHDALLGSLWDEARIRVEVDIQAGRPPFTLHGLVPATNPYLPDHFSHRADPGGWSCTEPHVTTGALCLGLA
ncbi:MAG: hypothetical protein M3424_02400, partial [Actinomycetota bacterium]|nr:hypothetical protein [Actinomycetota bacterium]